jgi:hypothetical protein
VPRPRVTFAAAGATNVPGQHVFCCRDIGTHNRSARLLLQGFIEVPRSGILRAFRVPGGAFASRLAAEHAFQALALQESHVVR